MVAEMPSDRDLINSQQEALLGETKRADVAIARAVAAEAQVRQLKAALEEIRDHPWGETTIIGHMCRTALADVPEDNA